MKYEQMLFALMILVATAGAVNDTITVGSCEISFYLNDVDYVVTIGKTVSNQSISGVEHNYTEATISTEGGSVYIDVDSYDAVSTYPSPKSNF